MPENDNPILASNKKAFHDYSVIECYEAGIQLAGTEVKSCRNRQITMLDSFISIDNGQAWLHNMHIASYEQGNRFNHNAKRVRKLLLNKREILKIAHHLNIKGGTVVPLKVYLKHNIVKVEIAICQGKTHADKRETLRRRDDEMEIRRAQRSGK